MKCTTRARANDKNLAYVVKKGWHGHVQYFRVDHLNLHFLSCIISHHPRLISITMSSPIANIRNYALEARRSRDQEMENDASDAKTEARLDQTIKELQERLRARKLELEKVGVCSPLLSAIEP